MELLAAEQGLLVRREHANIAAQLDYATRKGELRRLLPGIYCAPEPDLAVRVLAATAFRPGCVVTGAAAARLLWWPEVTVGDVSLAVPHTVCGRYEGFAWERRRVPADLAVDRDQVRIAAPAVSVLDLIPSLGGTVIDEALRRGAVTLSDLWSTMTELGQRPGNAFRSTLLHDSRDEPWSEAERSAHRTLRQAGITGWRTNYRVRALGADFWVDIAFPEHRVIVEVDGWQFHGGREAFTRDRWRYATLAAAGWVVLPFAATALTDETDTFLKVVRAALARCTF